MNQVITILRVYEGVVLTRRTPAQLLRDALQVHINNGCRITAIAPCPADELGAHDFVVVLD